VVERHTVNSFDGAMPLPHLKVTVSGHLNNGIQWQRDQS
jgi:hypothetical protein